MKLIKYALALACMASAMGAAHATTYKLTYAGNVNYTSTSADGVTFTQNPAASLISAGSSYTMTMTFDAASARVTSLYNADPTINIYNFSAPITVNLDFGTYRWSQVLSGNDLSLQLWNGRYVGASVPHTDAQSFTLGTNPYLDPTPSSYPFSMGLGKVSASLSAYAFDSSGTARSNDLIAQLVSPSLFASKSLEYSLYNGDTKRFFFVSAGVTSASLLALPSVPEPISWAMFIGGFGLIGATMRVRKHASDAPWQR